MSTITRELAKLFRKITNSEIDAEGNAHVVLSPADSLLINNARIALASLEAEASGRNPVLAYADSYRNMANHGVESIPVWSVITDLERNIAPLFTAPPAPVALPSGYSDFEEIWSSSTHPLTQDDEMKDFAWDIWNACRTTMLKSFGNSEQLNSPVIPDGWVMVPEDPTHEMLEAGDEQFGTYDVYRRMIEAAPKLE
ncbi:MULTISPECIES: hypothetical protein [Enterobacter cloacae complex]|uniref:hypothetical protein n=1 Tax=Enterobacter cloacae complex TaxID=354276 RepID=UPI001CC8F74A|nr:MULTISPECIES: hypothetical protein [Enterobacter cloacae complex]MCO7415654.1 hypothetical protein [Enterobacter asburiae]UBM19812.1 hypothetical protein LBF07_04675 [Enterobacter cloacae complex sp. ECL352]